MTWSRFRINIVFFALLLGVPACQDNRGKVDYAPPDDRIVDVQVDFGGAPAPKARPNGTPKQEKTPVPEPPPDK